MDRPKILMLTRLFPSKEFPTNGIFCSERAKALSRYADVRVMVPTPYYPWLFRSIGLWGRWAKVEREGLFPENVLVSYPRFVSLPKMATWYQGVSIARSAHKEFVRRHNGWLPDVVHGHFAFPDGYAAVKLAQRLKCPSLVTCHGSDLLRYPKLFIAGSMLRQTLRNSSRVVCVSPSLLKCAIELGCQRYKVHFLPNGVDTDRFVVRSKTECRRRLHLPVKGRIAICVGHLIGLKNQSTLIRALAELRGREESMPHLVLIGDGRNRHCLEREAKKLGLSNSITFAGGRPYDEIPYWLAASDWLVLSSNYEGWPSVYFETMACGRPVITSNVDAAKEAIISEDFGMIVKSNVPEAFATAFKRAQYRRFVPGTIRDYAEQHSWDRWAKSLLVIIQELRLKKG